MVLFLTVLSLVYMTVCVIQIALSFARADRKEKCRLLKNYKKGKFAAIFLAVFPLYVAAYIYAGDSVIRILTESFNSTIDVIALSFNSKVLEPVAKEFPLFRIAVVLCMALSVINALIFSVSIFFRAVYNRIKLCLIRKQKRDVCVFLGFEEKADYILSSLIEDERDVDILVFSLDITDEFKEKMYVSRVAYLPFSPSCDLQKILTDACGGFYKRHCSLIISTGNEEENLRLAVCAAQISNSLGEALCLANDGKAGLDAYLFSEKESETVYRRISRTSFGTVHCKNRYQMLAAEFTEKYPITQFIPELIDTQHAALKEGTEIKITMVGFGKVNRQLFRVFTQNNQCMIMEGDTPKSYPLSYTIFDNAPECVGSSFNHTYLRYNKWKKELDNTGDYFELPEEPADIRFEKATIDSGEFFQKLNSSLSTCQRGYNLIVIATGKDIEALDLAEKIATNVYELGAENKTKIFVRIRNLALAKELSHLSDNEDLIIPFGDDISLFTYDKIVNPSSDSMAKDRHLCYSIEGCQSDVSEKDAYINALRKWFFEWESVQRDSNVYAVMSIRMRLQLLGYDCVPVSDPTPDASSEFMRDYTRENPIQYGEGVYNGKRLVNYKTDYRRAGTPRSVLGETEHARWNAYYIGCGFVPASKSEFKEKGKAALMRSRKHINLTTFKGLDDYDKWRTESNTPEENRPDIIFYDYQLMDDAAWLLSRNGYKIIRRKPYKENI